MLLCDAADARFRDGFQRREFHMNRERSVLALMAAVALGTLSGCPTTNSDPVELDELPALLAANGCDYAARCQGGVRAYESLLGEQVTDCEAQLARWYQQGFASLHAAIEAGRVRYHGDLARRCLDWQRGAACYSTPVDDSCLEVFEGAVADGGACFRSDECESRRCDGASGCTAGSCVHLPELGEVCTASCAWGSRCDGETSRCVAYLQEGDACESVVDCGPSLVCEEGTCQVFQPAGEGEVCGTCAAGLVCEASSSGPGMCRRPRTDGTCTASFGGASDCPADRTCIEGTCQPYPAVGASCVSACVRGARCVGGVCAAPAAVGAACTEARACATEVCIDGRCAEDPICE